MAEGGFDDMEMGELEKKYPDNNDMTYEELKNQ